MTLGVASHLAAVTCQFESRYKNSLWPAHKFIVADNSSFL